MPCLPLLQLEMIVRSNSFMKIGLSYAALAIKRNFIVTLKQLLATSSLTIRLKNMGLVAGFLAPITSRAFRYGGARDAAHLPEITDGYTNHTVRQSIGHSMQSFNGGTTQGYIGDPDREVWNARQTRNYSSKFDSSFAVESPVAQVKSPATDDEISAWLVRHEPDNVDSESTRVRSRAITGVRKKRHTKWLKEAEPEKTDKKAVKKKASSKKQPTPADPNIDPRADNDFEDADEAIYENADADAEEVIYLMGILLPSDENAQEGDPAELEDMAVDEILSPKESTGTMIGFIERFSRINTLKTIPLGLSFKQAPDKTFVLKNPPFENTFKETSAELHQQGNSRDTISPWIFPCTAVTGCDFKCTVFKTTRRHMQICSNLLHYVTYRRRHLYAYLRTVRDLTEPTRHCTHTCG